MNFRKSEIHNIYYIGLIHALIIAGRGAMLFSMPMVFSNPK